MELRNYLLKQTVTDVGRSTVDRFVVVCRRVDVSIVVTAVAVAGAGAGADDGNKDNKVMR
jgi:hypothetical protein